MTTTESKNLSEKICTAHDEAYEAIMAYKSINVIFREKIREEKENSPTRYAVCNTIMEAVYYDCPSTMDQQLWRLTYRWPRTLEKRYDMLAEVKRLKDVANARREAIACLISILKGDV